MSVGDPIVEAITEWWGPRCEDFEPECFCCKAWLAYDQQAARIKALEDWQAKAVDVIDDLINSIDALKTFTVDPHSVDAARALLGGSNVSE